jgi:hypothetical protein
MLPASYDEILSGEGFVPIGRIDYRLRLSMWWNSAADRRAQLLILSVGQSALLKASKTYLLQSVSQQGETWARDIPALHSYLEDHFPEIHLSFCHFRDVPAALAELEARRRMAVEAPTRPPPTLEQIALLQREIDNRRQNIASAHHLMTLGAMESDLLSDYAHRQAAAQSRQIEALQAELEQQNQRANVLGQLQREYQRKGSAAVYQFTINSNLQTASNMQEFSDALRQATKEVSDLHRYQITQKLQGGKLNIQVVESEEPAPDFNISSGLQCKSLFYKD